MKKLAEALLEFETLTGDEIKDLLKGKKIRKGNGELKVGKKVNGKVKRLIPRFKEERKE